jgi:amidase
VSAVFEWDASSHGYAYQLWEKAILSDGGEGCRRKIEMTGEPLIEGMLVGSEKDILTTSETHQVLSPSPFILCPGVFSCTNYTQLNADKYLYESEYLERWTTSGIDALIMPNTPWVGYKPWTWVKSNAYVGYTSIWNLLGYAALAVPATTVSREKDICDQEWLDHVPRNAGDEFNKEQCKSGCRNVFEVVY